MKKFQLRKIIKEELLKEFGDNTLDWRVKDIIKMKKGHENVLNKVAALDKAIAKLEKQTGWNAGKANAGMFASDLLDMRNALDIFILDPKSKFWKAWDAYQKGGRAAFGDDWDY